jgi:ACS family glucarate transporter-like MFS transporter
MKIDTPLSSYAPVSDKIEMSLNKSARLLLLGFLFLLSIVTYLDRVNISIASAYIEPEFKIDHLHLGTIFSAFVVGYMLFQIPGGWIGDHFGHKKFLVFALVMWSVFTGLTAWAGIVYVTSLVGLLPSFWVVRFLVGAGEAAAYPCANGIISDWFGGQERGLATGIMFAGIGVGSAVTPPFVAWTMVHFGWRAAFLLSAVVGILLALLFHVGIADRPPDDGRCEHSAGEVGRANGSGLCPHSSVARERRKTPWKQILGSSQVWILVVSIFFFGYVTYVYYFWFYPYLVNIRGISLLRSSFLTSLPFLAMALSAPLGGWLSDRLIPRIGKPSARRRVAMGGLIAGALLIPCGATTPSAYLAVACLSLGAGSVYLAISCYFATALDIFPDHAATVSGTMNTGAGLGGIVAPMLTPWLAAHFGWAAALSLAGVFSLFAAILWRFTGSKEVETRAP